MQIKLENVNFIYNEGSEEESRAINNISLELGGDSFIAIIGSTGSGKSTLIQLLNGLLKPGSGKITWDGEEIYGLKDEKKLIRDIRCRVGLAFQYPEHQLFETDVYSDVAYGPKNLGLDDDEIKHRTEEALLAVGLEKELYEKSPYELSGGQMRRAAIAGILAMKPEVLILDEPTAGLDPKGKTEILEKIKEIQTGLHMTVILVSHTMEEVAKYADRVIAIDRGSVAMDLPVHEIFKKHKELEELGLKAPEVKYFVEGLAAKGLDIDTDAITVSEARDAILEAVKNR